MSSTRIIQVVPFAGASSSANGRSPETLHKNEQTEPSLFLTSHSSPQQQFMVGMRSKVSPWFTETFNYWVLVITAGCSGSIVISSLRYPLDMLFKEDIEEGTTSACFIGSILVALYVLGQVSLIYFRATLLAGISRPWLFIVSLLPMLVAAWFFCASMLGKRFSADGSETCSPSMLSSLLLTMCFAFYVASSAVFAHGITGICHPKVRSLKLFLISNLSTFVSLSIGILVVGVAEHGSRSIVLLCVLTDFVIFVYAVQAHLKQLRLQGVPPSHTERYPLELEDYQWTLLFAFILGTSFFVAAIHNSWVAFTHETITPVKHAIVIKHLAWIAFVASKLLVSIFLEESRRTKRIRAVMLFAFLVSSVTMSVITVRARSSSDRSSIIWVESPGGFLQTFFLASSLYSLDAGLPGIANTLRLSLLYTTVCAFVISLLSSPSILWARPQSFNMVVSCLVFVDALATLFILRESMRIRPFPINQSAGGRFIQPVSPS